MWEILKHIIQTHPDLEIKTKARELRHALNAAKGMNKRAVREKIESFLTEINYNHDTRPANHHLPQ